MIVSLKEFIDVLLAVEAFIEYIVQVPDIQFLKGRQKIVDRLHVRDIGWDSVIVQRQFAFLTEEHGRIELGKPLLIPIVSPVNVFIQCAVG